MQLAKHGMARLRDEDNTLTYNGLLILTVTSMESLTFKRLFCMMRDCLFLIDLYFYCYLLSFFCGLRTNVYKTITENRNKISTFNVFILYGKTMIRNVM